LAPDDEAAAQCLYPVLSTLVLIDQTGSMCTGTRMADAQSSATFLADELANNATAIAALADDHSSDCATCPAGTSRLGYELLQDYTDDVNALHTAINSTCPRGFTPMWESVCCAINTAVQAGAQPSNVLVITDTGENNSGEQIFPWPPGGDCSACVNGAD